MSYTKGVSFHHETNAGSNPTINNNISINASNELNQSNPSVVIESGNESDKVASASQSEPSAIERENEFLKKVLELYMNQQIYWSGKFIVLKIDELLELIHILIPNRQIKIFTDDIEVNCCGVNKEVPFVKVNSIWVDNEKHEQENFKYVHSNIVSLLENYRISIKFVRA